MKLQHGHLILLSMLLVFFLVLAVGCGEPEEVVEDPEAEVEPDPDPDDVDEDPDEPKTGGRLVIGWDEEADTLHPHMTAAIASNFVMAQMGDALLTRDPDTGDIEPHLAESYEISEDGREITFHLRQDVKFHSGEPFDAHALHNTFKRSQWEGHEQVRGRLGPIVDLVVEDDYTYTMIYEEPFGPLLINLAGAGYLHAMDPAHLEEYGDEDYGRNPASTGPWKFDEWVSGESITLVRNEDYNWPEYFYDNRGPAYLDEIHIRYIDEGATRMAALETGEIDVASVALADIDTFLDHPDFEIFEFDREGVCASLWFNHDREPLDDVLVRRALAWGMNKQAIINAAVDGYAEPAHGILPPTMWGYWEGVEDIAYSHDPDKAAELLDEAGWVLPNGADVREKDGEKLSLELWVRPGDEVMRTAEMLQAQYAELGVEIIIDTYEWGTLMEYLSEGRHDLTIIGYSSTDPDWLHRIFHSSEAGVGLNWAFVRDEELDRVLEGIRYTLDPEERAYYAKEGQRMSIENAHWAPIYRSDQYIAVNERVNDFRVNFRGTWLLHDVWLDD